MRHRRRRWVGRGRRGNREGEKGRDGPGVGQAVVAMRVQFMVEAQKTQVGGDGEGEGEARRMEGGGREGEQEGDGI